MSLWGQECVSLFGCLLSQKRRLDYSRSNRAGQQPCLLGLVAEQRPWRTADLENSPWDRGKSMSTTIESE